MAPALALATVVGLSLGLMGGGGSILTVPILVYVAGFEAKSAIALSLAVVGVTALAGVFGHWRSGNVDVRVALVFGAVAMAGTYAGTQLAGLLSGPAQLVLFAGVMLVAAYFMARGRRPAPRDGTGVAGGPAGGAAPESGTEAGDGRGARVRLPLLVGQALGVGVMTGIVGVGGGFAVVPALVLLAGLSMKRAVGTSLLVIAMNSAAGFYGYLGQVSIPWGFMAGFAGLAVAGILAGTFLVRFVSQGALRRGFAAFLVVMGVFILYRNRSVLLPSPVSASKTELSH